MRLILLKAKIHSAAATRPELHDDGSCAIDERLPTAFGSRCDQIAMQAA